MKILINNGESITIGINHKDNHKDDTKWITVLNNNNELIFREFGSIQVGLDECTPEPPAQEMI